VHHALRAFGEDRLQELKKLDLGLNHLSNGHGVISGAQHVTLLDLLFFEVADLELNIITSSTILNLLLLVISDAKHLARCAAWLKAKLITKANSTLLDLSEDDTARAILHLIEDGDTKRCLVMAWRDFKVIENAEESGALVPAADTVGNWLEDVGTGQAGDGHPEDVILSVAALEKEG